MKFRDPSGDLSERKANEIEMREMLIEALILDKM